MTLYLDDVVGDSRLLADCVDDLVRDVEALDVEEDWLAILMSVRGVMLAASAALLGVRQELDTKIARTIGPDQAIVDGKRVRRHPRLSKRNADNAALLRAVLDTVLIDPDTGEVFEETQLDKVKAVWPLDVHSARNGALKQRRIDPDEFCETEFRGFNLEVR